MYSDLRNNLNELNDFLKNIFGNDNFARANNVNQILNDILNDYEFLNNLIEIVNKYIKLENDIIEKYNIYNQYILLLMEISNIIRVDIDPKDNPMNCKNNFNIGNQIFENIHHFL